MIVKQVHLSAGFPLQADLAAFEKVHCWLRLSSIKILFPMNVVIEKTVDSDGTERFVLVNESTRDVIIKKPVTESTIRNYLRSIGETSKLIDAGLDKARKRYEKSLAKDSLDDDDGLEDIFSEIAMDDGESSGSDIF